MSLRKQIIFIFLSAVIVPILLVSAVMSLGMSRQFRLLRETYGIESQEELYNGISTGMAGRMNQKVEETLLQILQTNPDALLNIEYCESLMEEMKQSQTFVQIRQEGELIYDGSQSMDQLPEILPDYGEGAENYTYLSDSSLLFKQLDFTFSDGTEGSVFIYTRTGTTIPEMRTMALEVAGAVLLVILLMIMAISAWTLQVIIRPVRMLRNSAQRIKDGDLDFKIEVNDPNPDEIGQLCLDFDEMRQRLKESSEQKIRIDQENSELIRNISHDLKTPITSIRGYSEAIMDGLANSPEKLEHYVRTIYNKANDMQALIDELAYYSKIDNDTIPYNWVDLDVRDYFDDCAEELQMDLETDGVEFTYEDHLKSGTRILADPEQLKKVINNIIGNSVKYMDKEEKKISMRVLDADTAVHVAISDNGRGIARKDLGLIFDRFYRADAARTSSKGGSGIGLSIVKKILTDHKGRIWAESVEGEGTTIHFEIKKKTEDAS